MKTILLKPGKQKKRLRIVLFVFFFFLSLPIYFLLQTTYSQLENEAYFSARNQAETLVNQIDLNLQQLLKNEQNRSIAEYSFFNVMENTLLSESTSVKFSPLSEIPPKTDIKGMVGYFQINTDGSFHLPALPELGQDNLSGLSLAELETRITLKKKLRELLSIKPLVVEHLPPIAASHKSEPVVSKRSYMDEFIQQDKIASSMPITERKLKAKQDSSFKTRRLRSFKDTTSAKKLNKKYNTRKETVQLPDQAMASSYFNRSKQQDDSVREEQESSQQTNTQDLTPQSVINVLSIESEVTPLQLLFISQDYLCFYRYVWHDNNRYTQGFIVNSHEFLNSATQNLINSTLVSRLDFTHQNTLIQSVQILDAPEQLQLYQRKLATPFQNLQVTVNSSLIHHVPGSLLIDLLAFSLYSVLFIGFIIFYRLGSKQIELARQQQNFISAVSHELKTPLTSIRMYGEMLRSGWVSDDTKKQNYYDFIFFESERLSRLINNVLQLARIDHQNNSAELVSCSAQDLLEQISSKIEVQIKASCFTLNILHPKNCNKHIKINTDSFFQIIINLVDNAIKFSNHADKKQIDIGYRTNKNQKQLVFFIRDFGPGINDKQINKVFQLFYRSGDELTRTTPGTGIGLALVAQLAESMNAKVAVRNQQPGAEFQISFSMT